MKTKSAVNRTINTTVSPCIFKRTWDSAPEIGIAIGDCDVIIDADFKLVKTSI